MDQLPIFLNLRDQPVLLVGAGEAAKAKRRLIEAAGGHIVTDGARIAIVALDDTDEAGRIAATLKKRGLLVNVVDRPTLCDFTIPAIIDRSPVIIAIGTGGASATLAKALRERLEALLPSSLGKTAVALHGLRQRLKAALPKPAERRRFLDRLLAPGGTLDPLAGECDVEKGVETALQPGGARPQAREIEIKVFSDDPDDLSLRQLRALSQADILIVEENMPDAILDRARRDAVRMSSGEEQPIAGDALVVRLSRRGA